MALLVTLVWATMPAQLRPAALGTGSADGGHSGAATVEPMQANLLAGLPVRFEANHGQSDPEVRFLARGAGYTLFLTPDEVVLTLARTAPDSQPLNATALPGPAGDTSAPGDVDVVRLRLEAGNPDPVMVGSSPLEGASNYYVGAEESEWHTEVPAYGGVTYRDAYPGIDVVYHGDHGQLKFDFVVAPGVDPSVIDVGVDGGELVLDGGDLVLATPGGEIRQPKPFVYQEVDGRRVAVPAGYVLLGTDRFGFSLGDYDPRLPLIIDPEVLYATYLGGRSTDTFTDMVVDAEGHAYVTGVTVSDDFPERNNQNPKPPFQTETGQKRHAFVAKLNPNGTDLLYSTFLGAASQSSSAESIDLVPDGSGSVYVAGTSQGKGFPVAGNGVGSSREDGQGRGFLTRLRSPGGKIEYSTHLDNALGPAAPTAMASATDGVYLAGSTLSALNTTPNAVERNQPTVSGGKTAFVVKVDPGMPASGDDFVRYATYFGSGEFAMNDVAADGFGRGQKQDR